MKLIRFVAKNSALLALVSVLTSGAWAEEKLQPINEEGRVYGYAFLYIWEGLYTAASFCSLKFPASAQLWSAAMNETEKEHRADIARLAEIAKSMEEKLRGEWLDQSSRTPIATRLRRVVLFQKAKTLHSNLFLKKANEIKDEDQLKAFCDSSLNQQKDNAGSKDVFITPEMELLFKSLAL